MTSTPDPIFPDPEPHGPPIDPPGPSNGPSSPPDPHHMFDPDNSPVDGLYSQIRQTAADVKSLNLQISANAIQGQRLVEARDQKVADLVALRSGITRELVGFDVG